MDGDDAPPRHVPFQIHKILKNGREPVIAVDERKIDWVGEGLESIRIAKQLSAGPGDHPNCGG
jgi:hypothetical protein